MHAAKSTVLKLFPVTIVSMGFVACFLLSVLYVSITETSVGYYGLISGLNIDITLTVHSNDTVIIETTGPSDTCFGIGFNDNPETISMNNSWAIRICNYTQTAPIIDEYLLGHHQINSYNPNTIISYDFTDDGAIIQRTASGLFHDYGNASYEGRQCNILAIFSDGFNNVHDQYCM